MPYPGDTEFRATMKSAWERFEQKGRCNIRVDDNFMRGRLRSAAYSRARKAGLTIITRKTPCGLSIIKVTK